LERSESSLQLAVKVQRVEWKGGEDIEREVSSSTLTTLPAFATLQHTATNQQKKEKKKKETKQTRSTKKERYTEETDFTYQGNTYCAPCSV